jgi:hypothetical protein
LIREHILTLRKTFDISERCPDPGQRAPHAKVAQHPCDLSDYAPATKPKRDKMTDLARMLNALRRPKILVRAARAGLVDYRRERDLKRLLRQARGAAPAQAIGTLLAEEDRLEADRTSGDATYSVQRHVAVLTAILAEARLMPSAAPA